MTPDAAMPPLLDAAGVRKHYRRPFGEPVTALAGVDVQIHAGKSVGIAGESGSGKSSMLRLLLGVDKPSAGHVSFRGQRIDAMGEGALRSFRSEVQPVLQDTTGCFNPRMRILDAVTEPARQLRGIRGEQILALGERLLRSMGLPREHLTRYPHQLSGGQRQRVAIARALSCSPSVLLLDEPVTALDVSVRGSILNLFREQAAENGLTYVVVSHDLLSIYYLTDYLYIMRWGQVVEQGPTIDVIREPQHPYTQLLVRSVADPLYDAAAP